jgi:cobalt-precorrin 5A hydrolase
VIKIVALTDAGARLGHFLQQQLAGSELWVKPKPFTDKVQNAFKAGDCLILICATGIAVRTLAPVLKSKLEDPPVLVLDEQGSFVIPLLSGHEGGANDWGADIATLLKSELVITTAQPYLRPVYSVGMGCERHCPKDELMRLLDQCLDQAQLDISQIASINSINIKADEVGLIELAAMLEKPFYTWGIECLGRVEHLLSVRSDYVYNTVGVYGVAESAALVGASEQTGEEAELLLVKQKTAKATCSIARSYPGQVGF